MPELDKDFVASNIEFADKAKGNKYGTILPIIANFSDQAFSKQVKSSFINAAKGKKDEMSIVVSWMYSPLLTKRRNDAMIKRSKMRKDDHRIQAYIKYPAALMVKYPRESAYILYAEYQTCLSLKTQPIYSTINKIYHLINYMLLG